MRMTAPVNGPQLHALAGQASTQISDTDSEANMPVTNVLDGVASSDLARSRAWWSQLLGREPDVTPMPSDLEWHFNGDGIQLLDDSEHAGHSSVTLPSNWTS